MAKAQPQPKKVAQVAQPQKSVAKKSSSSGFKLPESQNKTILFDKLNYILLALGGLLIVIGFFLMAGGNQDPAVFNEAELYSFRRITLSPIVILIGFAIIGVSILIRPKNQATA